MNHVETLEPGTLSIVGVTKTYGNFTALQDVSMTIRAGEFVTLLGPSGSGKTTLLNVIAGFERPSKGSLMVDGEEFIAKPPHKRNLGIVFQNYALFPHMDVFGNVAYPLRLRSIPAGSIRKRVLEALDLVQMGHLHQRRIDELSGGQRQRVAFARAIVFEPKILLMDEPLSALDKNLRESMQIELKRLHKRLGTTTIYVTHDQQEALTMSDRIAILTEGMVCQFDTPEAVYERPNSKFVASFLGETRFLPVERRTGGYFLNGSQKLSLPDDFSSSGQNVELTIRPECLEWSGDPDRDNRLEGKVVDVVYRGDHSLISLMLFDKYEIAVKHTPLVRESLPRPGDRVVLWLRHKSTILLAE